MKTIWKMVPGLRNGARHCGRGQGTGVSRGAGGPAPDRRVRHCAVHRHGRQPLLSSRTRSRQPGIRFTSKKVLKLAIILLGASLNITTVLTVGSFSLTVMLFHAGHLLRPRLLHRQGARPELEDEQPHLTAGTGICGGSAIAAIAPVIDATDIDVAYGIVRHVPVRHGDDRACSRFSAAGSGLSDAAFGLWAGTAVNDTSSVVATGYAFSEAGGRFCHHGQAHAHAGDHPDGARSLPLISLRA